MKSINIDWEKSGILNPIKDEDKKAELSRLLTNFADTVSLSNCEGIDGVIFSIYARLYETLKLPLGKFELVVDELDLIETALMLWQTLKDIANSAVGINLDAEFCHICTESYVEKLKQIYRIKR